MWPTVTYSSRERDFPIWKKSTNAKLMMLLDDPAPNWQSGGGKERKNETRAKRNGREERRRGKRREWREAKEKKERKGGWEAKGNRGERVKWRKWREKRDEKEEREEWQEEKETIRTRKHSGKMAMSHNKLLVKGGGRGWRGRGIAGDPPFRILNWEGNRCVFFPIVLQYFYVSTSACVYLTSGLSKDIFLNHSPIRNITFLSANISTPVSPSLYRSSIEQ